MFVNSLYLCYYSCHEKRDIMEKETRNKKPIEKKRWECYTREEKHELLNHWWYYFGKMLVTREEYMEFVKLAESNPDTVWSIAVLCFGQGLTSQPLIFAMRHGRLEEFISVSCDLSKRLSTARDPYWRFLEDGLLDNLVPTYNNPEPDVPFSEGEKRKQIEALTGVKNPTLVTVDLDELGRQMS